MIYIRRDNEYQMPQCLLSEFTADIRASVKHGIDAAHVNFYTTFIKPMSGFISTFIINLNERQRQPRIFPMVKARRLHFSETVLFSALLKMTMSNTVWQGRNVSQNQWENRAQPEVGHNVGQQH